MISSMNNTLSALRALGQKMAVSAHNTANVYTQGYKKSRVNLTQNANGGVQAQTVQANAQQPTQTAQTLDQSSDEEPSDVDMAEEITQSTLTKRFYQANLKMIETQDEMLASTLDILA